MYKGVGSVVVGSAPGGTFPFFSFLSIEKLKREKNVNRVRVTLFFGFVAAVFFSTYDTLKRNSPLSPAYASVTHMVSASFAEVVRSLEDFFFQLLCNTSL